MRSKLDAKAWLLRLADDFDDAPRGDGLVSVSEELACELAQGLRDCVDTLIDLERANARWHSIDIEWAERVDFLVEKLAARDALGCEHEQHQTRP